MKLFSGLEHIVRLNEPMGGHTWLGLGGPAEYFVQPGNLDELQTVARRCRENDVPLHVLGGGANLLVTDGGVKGAVIHLGQGEFTDFSWSGGALSANAGADVGKIVLASVRQGMSGLECLTGIPGTVAGCVKMNAGGAFGDVGNIVETVEVMNSDGERFTRYRADLAFAYRSTNIGATFILSTTFKLTEDDPHNILRQIKRIWIYKKNTQPLSYSSCGCIFKNPRGLSAGALIDRAGLKGRRVGGAFVSQKHANFILVEPGASATDVLKLIDIVRQKVYKAREVFLELEMEVW